MTWSLAVATFSQHLELWGSTRSLHHAMSLFNFTQFLKSNANCKFIMPQARLPPQSRSNRSVAPNIPASKRWNYPPINPKLEKSFKQHHWLEDNTHGFLFKRTPSVCQTCPKFAAHPEINYYIADLYLIGFAFSPKCVEHSTSCLHMKLLIVHYCNVVQKRSLVFLHALIYDLFSELLVMFGIMSMNKKRVFVYKMNRWDSALIINPLITSQGIHHVLTSIYHIVHSACKNV